MINVDKKRPRGYTNAVIGLIDDGNVSADDLARALLNWLSDTDVAEFAERNLRDFFVSDEDDEDGDEDDEPVDETEFVLYIGATDAQVSWGGCDDPRGLLEEGHLYTVLEKDVHTWHTKIELVEFPGMYFNSVCFDDS